MARALHPVDFFRLGLGQIIGENGDSRRRRNIIPEPRARNLNGASNAPRHIHAIEIPKRVGVAGLESAAHTPLPALADITTPDDLRRGLGRILV